MGIFYPKPPNGSFDFKGLGDKKIFQPAWGKISILEPISLWRKFMERRNGGLARVSGHVGHFRVFPWKRLL